jgi:dienelactone hydrolase
VNTGDVPRHSLNDLDSFRIGRCRRAGIISTIVTLAPGDRLGPYEILALIGEGGMGEVYRGRDTRLNRTVAIKVVTPILATSPGFRERFEREAHTISQLNHPNICTLYDIGSQGELAYFVMEFVEGETLAQRIGRGPLPLADAVAIAHQIAQALASAHQLGIVHRDIKPANVMLTRSDFVKVLDFGLAKVEQPQDATASGIALGTLAYMAPERLLTDGHSRAASDVWSLGVVIHEMLSGTRPFKAPSEVALFKSILTDRAAPIEGGRDDVPRSLKRLIDRSLEKDPENRFRSATELEAGLSTCRAELAAAGTNPGRRVPARVKKWLLAGALLAGVAAAGVATWATVKSSRVRWAREQAIPEIERLIEQDRYLEAFTLANRADAYVHDDPRLTALWPAISVVGSWNTTPPGAEILFKEYAAPDAPWHTLGVTPLHGNTRLPRGALRFLVQKEGFEPLHLARAVTPPFAPETIELHPAGTLEDMVAVPGDTLPVNLSGFNTEHVVTVGPFRIDRTEVTNRAYKQFVDAGGYEQARFWQSAGADRSKLIDSTGRPGPAAWELGEYPEGRGDDPVSGVSWFEASAYCQFRGKTLPTVYHWARAALPPRELPAPLGPSIVPLSNFGGKGVAPVASYGGMGPYGTFDLAGNVREWVWNLSTEGRRWILGGSWNDPDYIFSVPFSLPPGDRSPVNGFRCISSEDQAAIPDTLLSQVDVSSPDYRGARPVSDEVFNLFARQFAYIPSTAGAIVEGRTETPTGTVRERVTLDAGYDGERLPVYLFLPKSGRPPYQAVIYFPALNAFQSRTSSSTFYPADYIVKSGRAVVLPVFKGSFERWDPALGLTGEEYFRATRQRLLQWRQDLGRTIDYLGTRGDIDMKHLGYYGRSFGASMPLPLLALEARLQVAVLHSAGFTYRRLPAEMDAVNYVSRIKMPVLMMTGRHDYVFPYQTSQKPLFDLLGTPLRDKRHVIYDAGHDPLPRSLVVREILSWLDRYLGPSGKESE